MLFYNYRIYSCTVFLVCGAYSSRLQVRGHPGSRDSKSDTRARRSRRRSSTSSLRANINRASASDPDRSVAVLHFPRPHFSRFVSVLNRGSGGTLSRPPLRSKHIPRESRNVREGKVECALMLCSTFSSLPHSIPSSLLSINLRCTLTPA